MAPRRMHADEVEIDVDIVRALVAEQFPQWAPLPLEVVRSTGTVNALYRLGEDLCVRLPRRAVWAESLAMELEWLPRLAPQVSLAIPEPVAAGTPAARYPLRWAIFRWIEGETYAAERVDDERVVAAQLAEFVMQLRRVDGDGAPRCHRGRPLRVLDPSARAALDSLRDRDVIDTAAATAAWEASLDGAAWDSDAVFSHGDLLPPNLLVDCGRLRAVIDFGGGGVGDPAVDVIPAWAAFGPDGRAVYRAALDVDDATWARARGIALHQALMIIPYYLDTNPGFVAMATRTVERIVSEVS